MTTPQARHQHLSQRALVLSVGALALSVVAMTTMFIFVYSHGQGALEAGGKAAASPASSQVASNPEQPAGEASLALQTPERCPTPDPLVRTSIRELTVQQHALQPGGSTPPAAPAGAMPLDCD